MTDLQLFTELSSLPKELKQEVENFMAFLKAKSNQKQPAKKRKFGSAKGFFVVHDDFNEPLGDFKEYM